MVLMPLLSRLLTLLVILTMPLFLARLTLIPIKSLRDRKSGSAGMPRPISYAVFRLKKKNFPSSGHLFHLLPPCLFLRLFAVSCFIGLIFASKFILTSAPATFLLLSPACPSLFCCFDH